MSIIKPVVVFLGGKTVSGAEKRIVKTFALFSRKYDTSAILVVEEPLYKKMSNGEGFEEFLQEYKKIYIIWKPFCINPLFKIVYLTFLTAFLFVRMRGGFLPYFCLLSPLFAPPVLAMKKVFFEVTSPDIVKMRSMKHMVRLIGSRLTLVAVSESVESRVLEQLAAFQLYKCPKVLSRRVPFSEFTMSEASMQKKKIVVFAHRMIKRKNPMLAVLSFLDVAFEHPEWSFHIYGDGPLANEVANICESSQVSNVKYYGLSDDLQGVLRKSMIFVSLIEPDNYPSQSILEAMAYQNALILSDTGSTAKKLHKDNGFLVTLDVPSISHALKEAMKDSNRIKRMGELSRLHLINQFSIDTYLQDTYRIFDVQG